MVRRGGTSSRWALGLAWAVIAGGCSGGIEGPSVVGDGFVAPRQDVSDVGAEVGPDGVGPAEVTEPDGGDAEGEVEVPLETEVGDAVDDVGEIGGVDDTGEVEDVEDGDGSGDPADGEDAADGDGVGEVDAIVPVCEPACENGGLCVDDGVCDCALAAGWSGERCEVAVCVAGCDNGGACVGPETCDCEGTGFGGPTCGAPVCEPGCANGGVCVEPGECDCAAAEGWEGERCELPICAAIACDNGGVCGAPETCDCAGTGYGGPTCGEPVCEPGCANGGACVAPGSCDCAGALGWTGSSCEEPVCEPGCVNGGVCVAPGACDCAAAQGWAGARCEEPVCEPGCVNGVCAAPGVCDCEGTGLGGALCDEFICEPPCLNGGLCLDGDECDCEGTGYRGARCEVLICEPGCLNGGVCELTVCACLSPVVLASFTFEVSAPTTAGPHAAEGGVLGGASVVRAVHASGAVGYTNPVGNGSQEAFSANNWGVGDYFQVELPTVGYGALAIGWDQTRSGTGPGDFRLEWSADGVSFAPLMSYAVGVVTWSGTTFAAASRFPPVGLPVGANDQARVWVRFVATVAGASAGTNRIDNIVVTATGCDTGAACTLGCETGACSEVPTCDCEGTGYGGATCELPIR